MQNFAIMFTGSMAVAIIGFLLTPITSRLYSPAAYGEFAVFSALLSNLNLLTTLTYPGAIIQTESRDKAWSLFALSGLLTISFSVLSFVVLFIIRPWFSIHFQVTNLGAWILTIPVILFLFNINTIMSSWYTRHKIFTKKAGADVASTLLGKLFAIFYGWFSNGHPSGLVLGDFFSRATGTASLFSGGIYKEMKEIKYHYSWEKLRSVAWEFRQFPFYSLPERYINMLSIQTPIFVLTNYFGGTIVGLYSFSVSLMELPLSLIGYTITPVFYQKANETFLKQPERVKEIALELYQKMVYIGLLPFGVITVFGDVIFKYAFGSKWEMAGMFTGYLGFYYAFKLTSHPLSALYTVYNRQNQLLVSNCVLLIVRVIALFVGVYLNSVNIALLGFSIGSLVVIFLTDLHILRILKLPILKIALQTILLVSGSLIALFYLRKGFELIF